jgi:hypothetical protein
VSSWLPYFFLLLLLVLPSSTLQQFNGLPLSHAAEFFGLALLLPFLFSKQLRQRAADISAKIRLPFPVFAALAVAVLLLKVGLLVFNPQDGFVGCYSSPAEWAPGYSGEEPVGGCERSYEDLFHQSGATRADRTISFTPDSWNLNFFNSLRYNYYGGVSGTIPRDRIPISVRWSAQVTPVKPARVIIHYTGEGNLSVGSLTEDLPPSYDRIGELAFDLPAGKQNFSLEYSFNDHSRTGQSEESWGPRAQIRVAWIGKSGEQPLPVALPGLPWTAMATGADILLALLLLFLIAAWVAEAWKDKWILLALVGFTMVCYFLPLSQRVRGIGMTAGLIGFWLWHFIGRPVKPIAIYSILLCAGLGINLLYHPSPSQVVLRAATDDPLIYESEAYSILSSGSLEGGEKVFFFQPMFRYVKFAEHAVFGDGLTFSSAAQLALFLGGAFFLGKKAMEKGLSWKRKLPMAGIGSAILFLGGYYVSIVIRFGLSEYLTWSLLLWSLPLLFMQPTVPDCLLGLAALAFSFTVRTNQLLAVLWISLWVLWVLWKKDRRAFLFGLMLSAGILLLPLAHNLYYGHAFVLTTASSNLAINVPAPPSTWLAFLRGDPAAAAAVSAQLRWIFLIVDVSLSTWLILLPMAGILFLWIVASGIALVRREIADLPFLSVPLFYLAPHLFFAVNIYYPRHIMISYLSMAVVTAIWLARGQWKTNERMERSRAAKPVGI